MSEKEIEQAKIDAMMDEIYQRGGSCDWGMFVVDGLIYHVRNDKVVYIEGT